MAGNESTFTTRLLLSLVVDMASAAEVVERLRIQIEALAAEHGIAMPAVSEG